MTHPTTTPDAASTAAFAGSLPGPSAGANTSATTMSTAGAHPAPRLDLYTPIHKALRAFMTDTLVRLGSMDVDDDDERRRTLDQVDALLAQMKSHLDHENHFVHTAIEARWPGAASRTAHDHLDHLETICNLEDECSALRAARPEQRASLAMSLYRHLAAFVAENLEHMLVEERENNAALWAHYSDAELAHVHDLLLASIPPAEMLQSTRWLVVALSVAEL
ncbi:MAG TPA: hypothetical protein VK439_16760, partial [Rubrivivax sp.]|nr:hypothetical protein [Rubrivivax sp.]